MTSGERRQYCWIVGALNGTPAPQCPPPGKPCSVSLFLVVFESSELMSISDILILTGGPFYKVMDGASFKSKMGRKPCVFGSNTIR